MYNLRFHFLLSSFLFSFLLITAPSSGAVTGDKIQASIVEQLGYDPSVPFVIESPGVIPSGVDPQIADVYRENGFEPLWVDARGPTRKAAVLLNVLKSSSNEGLDAEDYHPARIESLWDNLDSKSLASVDILLTSSLHAYVSDVREGRLDPCLKNPDLFTCARDRRIDPVDLIAEAMSVPDLNLFLQNQPPDNDQYRNLRNILKQYREIDKNGGWPEVPEGPVLKPGMNDPRVPLIRKRLSAAVLPMPSELNDDTFIYDDATADAVMQFQEVHGLDVDGIFGEATRTAMNVPASSIIRRILINMERLRWLSRGAGNRFVIVNIASFQLAVIEDAHIVLQMPVIVGKNYRETPVFSDLISYIEFNPFWNIPPSIAQNDILPKLKKDPSYLAEMGIHVFDGWQAEAKELDPALIQWDTISRSQAAAFKFRQNPGPKNFLGRVKFMFPNRFSVYLHDTPSQDLFKYTTRTFSSGCIRLSRPLELAAVLLEGNDNRWNPDMIRQTVESGTRTVAKLGSPIPIHIVYLTAYTDMSGCVCFSKDVYGRDRLLEQALFGVNTAD